MNSILKLIFAISLAYMTSVSAEEGRGSNSSGVVSFNDPGSRRVDFQTPGGESGSIQIDRGDMVVLANKGVNRLTVTDAESLQFLSAMRLGEWILIRVQADSKRCKGRNILIATRNYSMKSWKLGGCGDNITATAYPWNVKFDIASSAGKTSAIFVRGYLLRDID